MAGFFGLGRRNKSKLINPPQSNQVVEVSDYSVWRLIGEIRNLATAQNYKNAEYDIMAEDTIIGAALQIYADSSVQYDENNERILEVTSENSALVKDIEAFLAKLKVEDRLWTTSFATAKYGNKFWKIVTNKSGNDIESIEELDDPDGVVDLYLQGEPMYYAYNPDDRQLAKTADYQLFDRNAFIHFAIQTGRPADFIELPDMNKVDPITHRPLIHKYKIHLGESMLEGVRAIYRIIKALEDSILAAAVARAEYSKIYNVEVGPDTNEIDARKIINKVKRLFDSRMAMDVREGQQSASTYQQVRPFMDPVFNAVSGGKGSIDIKATGGEIDVTQLAHLDYFNNLKFSGLHITPSMLAFEQNIPGGLGSSDSSLVYQDVRLAMYVKKLVMALTRGITDLVNIWLTLKNRKNEIGKFKINMVVPSAAEAMANLAELSANLDHIDHMISIIAKNAPGVNTTKVAIILLEEYIPNKTLLGKLKELMEESANLSDKELLVTSAELDSALMQFGAQSKEIDLMGVEMDQFLSQVPPDFPLISDQVLSGEVDDSSAIEQLEAIIPSIPPELLSMKPERLVTLVERGLLSPNQVDFIMQAQAYLSSQIVTPVPSRYV